MRRAIRCSLTSTAAYSPQEPGIIAQSRGGYLLSTLSTTPNAVADQPGVAFRVTTSGVLTVLHQFDPTEGVCALRRSDAGARTGGSMAPSVNGGINGYGSIFQMTPDGIVKTLHEFTAAGRRFSLCSADSEPVRRFLRNCIWDIGPRHPGTIYKIDTLRRFHASSCLYERWMGPLRLRRWCKRQTIGSTGPHCSAAQT